LASAGFFGTLAYSSPEQCWDLLGRIVQELDALKLQLAEAKSRLLASREGVPFAAFYSFPGGGPACSRRRSADTACGDAGRGWPR
jgi:hypothetical protein